MHKAAHCPNHNRLRMLSQPAIRLGLQAPATRACGIAKHSDRYLFIITAFTALIFGLSQNLCARSHRIIIIVNICTELRLAVIRNPGGQIIQFYRNTLANIHISGIPSFSVEDTRLLFQPASCSSIFAKSEALFTRTQPELSARISFWNRLWFGVSCR